MDESQGGQAVIRKISDFPDGPWRRLALEAQRQGLEITNDPQMRASDVMLIGAFNMIHQLTERIVTLENNTKHNTL